MYLPTESNNSIKALWHGSRSSSSGEQTAEVVGIDMETSSCMIYLYSQPGNINECNNSQFAMPFPLASSARFPMIEERLLPHPRIIMWTLVSFVGANCSWKRHKCGRLCCEVRLKDVGEGSCFRLTCNIYTSQKKSSRLNDIHDYI